MRYFSAGLRLPLCGRLAMFLKALFAAAVFGGAATALAQAPAGIVWTPGDATLVRQGTELSVRLEAGDLLFPGDSVDVRSGPSTFAHCSAKQEITITGPATIKVSGSDIQASGGSQRRPLLECVLPATNRQSLETVRFFGSRTRALGPVSATKPDDQPEEPRLTLARAVAFEKNGQLEAARDEFERLSRQMPAVDWPRRLAHEQEERIGRQQLLLAQQQAAATASAAGEKPPGKTFALRVCLFYNHE